MKDKVQKIREEVKRLQKRAEHNFDISLTENERQFWLGESNVLTLIGKYIDTMQEEPVSRIWHDASEKPNGKDYVIVWDGKYANIAHYNKVVNCQWCYLKDILDKQEEPVSEDLGEIILEGTNFNKSWYAHPELAFKAGVKWQKEQFEKNRLKHCNSITNEQAEFEQGFIDQHIDKYNRMPTFLDAIEYGMRLQKEQMIANAVDSRVYIDAGGYPYIPQMELYDYNKDVPLAKEGDKYKVVLIKED